MTQTTDKAQQAYAALERLIRKALADKITGSGSIHLDFHQGGISNIELHTREKHTSNTRG